jgi:hypothetical protein
MSEQQPESPTTIPQPIPNMPKRRSPLRRLGCSVALVVWFIVLLAPCLCIVLATQGEIAIRLGDIPGQSFRLWLLNESRERGLGISRPSLVTSSDANQVCLQTDVSFVLWVGSAEATTFCECYTHSYNLSNWELTSNHQGSCRP